MGHSYNHGLVTSLKGAALEAARVIDLNTTPNTVTEQCNSGFISTVTKGATGTYTVQLAAPYPPKVVVVIPSMSQADGTTDLRFAQYKTGSYDATTGQFIILVMNDDDSGAPVLADGSATDELHLLMIFRRYTT